MKKISETVVFFGSGPVAARSLELLAKWVQIEAVITKPRPAHHKGSFPVLEVAGTLELSTLHVTNRKELDALIATSTIKSRLGVLIDFGIIVSQAVIDYFPLGIINSHFSLLPQWRGADPITFSLLSGQSRTGVSLMQLTAGLDEGPLISVGEQAITPSLTNSELTDKLINLSDALLQHELPRVFTMSTRSVPQQQMHTLIANYPAQPSYSHKVNKQDGILDWHKPARQLEREVRAYLGWPGSRCTIGGHDAIITKAHVEIGEGTAGTLWRRGKSLGFYCGKDIFVIERLKPAGKPEMSAEAFLAGYGQNL